MLDRLQTLANDQKNTVFVLSGRGKDALERWFGRVDGLGLCAEHGVRRKPPAAMRSGNVAEMHDGWTSEVLFEDIEEWKDLVTELMEKYVQRVQGSILETKSCSISWNYREVGATGVVDDIALELARFLDPNNSKGLLRGYPVKVVNGKGYVEVKRADIDKGTSVLKTLEELGQVDFVLCIGDDRSDEDMFEAVKEYFGRGSTQKKSDLKRGSNPSFASMCSSFAASPEASPPMSPKLPPGSNRSSMATQTLTFTLDKPSATWFTATVGRKTTKAKHFLADVDEVSELLHKLASKTIVSSFSRFASLPNIGADLNVEDTDSEEDDQGGLERPTTTHALDSLRIKSSTRV